MTYARGLPEGLGPGFEIYRKVFINHKLRSTLAWSREVLNLPKNEYTSASAPYSMFSLLAAKSRDLFRLENFLLS
jgi:hypothetical protein